MVVAVVATNTGIFDTLKLVESVVLLTETVSFT